MQLTSPTAAPVDFERIARTLDNVFDGSYADEWENKALPVMLKSGRTADEIETIGGAVASAFASDDQSYEALVLSTKAQGSASAIAAAIRGVDEVFDGTYGDEWEVKSLPTVYGSRHLETAPVLLRSIANAFASDDESHTALVTTFESARPADQSATFVSGADATFDGTYGDEWELKAAKLTLPSQLSADSVTNAARAARTMANSDDARYEALETLVRHS